MPSRRVYGRAQGAQHGSGAATLAVALLAALIAAGWFSWRRFAPPPAPPTAPVAAAADEKLAHAPRLSIVVLPFTNLSGDAEQDYFADGLSDDLTTDLSHLPDSFVIAHNTALTYKGKPVDAKQLGRDLGVRYALEGSVRRTGETAAVNAQLISTETGAHIWADRLEGERSKLGALQVEAVSRIANALGVQLVNAENLRAIRERPANPDAADLAMRGLAAFYRGFTPENINKAIVYYDQALRSIRTTCRRLRARPRRKWSASCRSDSERNAGVEVLDDAEAASRSRHRHAARPCSRASRQGFDRKSQGSISTSGSPN